MLTGAATSYYASQAEIWNTEYLKLVNYQKKKEENAYADEALKASKLAANRLKHANTARRDKVTLPLRGHNLYIGDRVRDFWMRGELLKMQNIQQKEANAIQLEEIHREEMQLQTTMI